MIAQGSEAEVLLRIAGGEKLGTHFLPVATSIESRKRYILSGRQAPGQLVIDVGAEKALRKGASLLSIGLTSVAGVFDRGDTVRLVLQDGNEIARGIVNYDSRDLVQIVRCSSDEIESILGYHFGDEVIHHNNLVML